MTKRSEPPEAPVDLANCADEPIHTPGRVQPHGALFVLDEPGLNVRRASANAGEILGVPLASILGAGLEGLVSPSHREEARRWLLSEDVHESSPSRLRMRVGDAEATFDALAHRHEGRLILELENPRPGDEPRGSDLPIDVRKTMSKLEAARSLRDFCRVASAETRALTGFERVLVYKFDQDWHGEVFAEDRAEFLTPLMGLHFPSSDIPEQARRLYHVNRTRLIADVDAAAVPIVAAEAADDGPLDLSFAALRAVSPVHIQYLKNMGAKTSMSFSLLRDGRLWGLLSCMNYTGARYVPPAVRNACEFLAALVSVQLTVKEEGEGNEYRGRLQQVRERLLQRMAEEPDLARALTDDGEELLDLAGAQGAAVVHGQSCATVGVTPDEAQVLALVRWLRATAPDDVFQTDSLPRLHPEAMSYKDRACGLIAATTSRSHGHYVLWFRPEVIQTVDWGGDPNKPVEPGGSLSPRTSFDRWKEVVHLKSLPWHPAEVGAARALRDAIIAVVVRRAEELTRLNAELERSNSDLDAFAFTTSHDMKEPLRGIHNYATFLMEDYAEKLDAEGVERLESLVRLSQRMEDLVESMLQYSRLGRAELTCEDVDMNALVEEVLDLHRVMLEENRVRVRVPRPLPSARCDRVQVGQLLGNLVTNAVKYNDKPEKSIEIGWVEPAAPIEDGPAPPPSFYVKDDGIGIPEKHHQNVFRLFKRLHGREKFGGGTGAGLTFSKKIVERHGGSIWIESSPGEGATFHFTLSG